MKNSAAVFLMFVMGLGVGVAALVTTYLIFEFILKAFF